MMNNLIIYSEQDLCNIATNADHLSDVPTEIRINCAGVEIEVCLKVYRRLVEFDSPVTVKIEGIAGGGCGVIAMAADRLEMADGSAIVLNRCYSSEIGDASFMEAAAKRLSHCDNIIAKIYAEKTGLTIDYWLEKMAAEAWIDKNTATELGLIAAAKGATK